MTPTPLHPTPLPLSRSERTVPAASLSMHKLHCSRNMSKCGFCGKALPAREVEGHVAAARGSAAALVAAAAGGDVAAVAAMLTHGAAAGAACDAATGDTPLHIAARARRVGVADALLARGVSVNVANAGGETPLHAACGSRDSGVAADADSLADMVGFLVRRGCDVEARTALGDTPLHVAQRARNVDVMLLLTASGGALRPVRVCVCVWKGWRGVACNSTLGGGSRALLSFPACVRGAPLHVVCPQPLTRRQVETAACRAPTLRARDGGPAWLTWRRWAACCRVWWAGSGSAGWDRWRRQGGREAHACRRGVFAACVGGPCTHARRYLLAPRLPLLRPTRCPLPPPPQRQLLCPHPCPRARPGTTASAP
jgi:hypothetical protein